MAKLLLDVLRWMAKTRSSTCTRFSIISWQNLAWWNWFFTEILDGIVDQKLHTIMNKKWYMSLAEVSPITHAVSSTANVTSDTRETWLRRLSRVMIDIQYIKAKRQDVHIDNSWLCHTRQYCPKFLRFTSIENTVTPSSRYSACVNM